MQTQKFDNWEIAAFCDKHAMQTAWALLKDIEQKDFLKLKLSIK